MNATSPPEIPTASLELCSEAEVTRLVHGFYARVRQEDRLGPVFGGHVHDWPAHLEQLVDFWSAMLRGTRRFKGSPMSKHMAIALDKDLFDRWLVLFRQTTAECGNPPMQALADDVAARIADTFWRRYQMLRWPQVGLPVLGVPGRD
ncbi:group III truncated hemoglobin [Stenotrophomonas sp. YAU14A_MKIMI4_1]|uniref:group III truncated hemoglobin n=1 Tax=Stenotrophomonas sp. YAU14A_MKIMI4_1 TaxID=2072408 RepID=UPI000D541933|nr:group III truncated hemoglobin [Stenotrophomonas sp. YAU14A_MKIMI4_1]AWH31183.1 preprotein translocase subunit TatC [Stenotrophomonas sp. YAU14A_MKIMI4_1]